MLALTRKPEQIIQIGGNISVTILDIQREQIKVGFAVPENVVILREKLGRPDPAPRKPHEKN